MPPKKEAQEHAQSGSRANILATVTTPLALFALIALVIEGTLAVFATRASGANLTVLIYGMVGSLVLMILVVFVLLVFDRDIVLKSISTSAAPDFRQLIYTVTLAPPKEMPFFLTRVAWDHKQCFVRCADTTVPVRPAFGHGGYEVRLPSKILSKMTNTEPIELSLVDKKGLHWEVRPFLLRTEVPLICMETDATVVASYGDAE
jgi:hypothetical protein